MTSTNQPILDDSAYILHDDDVPYGVYYAARAAAQDIKEVVGTRPDVGSLCPEKAGLVIQVECDGALAARYGLADQISAPETFCIRAMEIDGSPTVLISANAERGAVYGLYHFSHAHLGTDPFKHITQYQPPKRKRIALRNVDYTRPPHVFRFRGWHTECNVSRWRYDLGQERMYWQRLMETLMRYQGNMIKADTNKPESMQISLAQRMGLLITQEHCEPFGLGAWDMESDEPGFNFIFDDYPQVFLDAWEDSMRRYPDPSKVIWTLGIRGRADCPFWEADPQRFDTDAKRGAYISRVLSAQKKLIEDRYGHHRPAFIHNTWMEGNRLQQEGHTTLPDGVHAVWSNNGYGSFRSMVAHGCRPDQIRENLPDSPPAHEHGVYYHAMVGDGCAPSLTQYVPPDRIERELGKVVDRKMTAYLLLNVGQVATTVMPIAAVADLWNDPDSWSGEAFLQRWCERHFGDQSDAARQCYHDYFDAMVRYGEWGGWDDYVFGDMGYARMATLFVHIALNHGRRRQFENLPPEATTRRFFGNRQMPVEEAMGHIESKMNEALPRWQKVHTDATGVYERLTGQSQRFFETDIRVQTEMHLYWVRYVLCMIAAVRAYGRGGLRDAIEARDKARGGQQCIRCIYESAKRRDFGRWYEACNWQEHWRYACLPKAWEAAQMLIDVTTTMIEARNNGYLNGEAIVHSAWTDSWSGPIEPYPFEDQAIDKVLPQGQYFRLFGRYKHEQK